MTGQSSTDPRRPYVRSMKGWWRRNTFYVEYMLHEATALFVAAYALVLLVGLIRLSQGEVAWDGYVQALKSPASIIFHLVILVVMIYHAWSWFKIMPRTLPPIMVGGKRLSAAAITRIGLTAVVVVSVFLFALVWGLAA